MEAQIRIPSGWAKLRADKKVKRMDMHLVIRGGSVSWVPLGEGCEDFTASDFGLVIFKLKARKERGSRSPKRNGIDPAENAE